MAGTKKATGITDGLVGKCVGLMLEDCPRYSVYLRLKTDRRNSIQEAGNRMISDLKGEGSVETGSTGEPHHDDNG